MNLLSRWLEFGAASIPDPPWPEVWAAVARGQASGRGLGEVENLLFRWRFSGWILSLDMDPSTCQVCGDRMSPGGNRPRISCSNRCRQLRVRHKAEGTPTSWGSSGRGSDGAGGCLGGALGSPAGLGASPAPASR